jgi:hypothetical protein
LRSSREASYRELAHLPLADISGWAEGEVEEDGKRR